MKRRQLDELKWTEARVTRAVVRTAFRGAVLAVPCCGWTGHEADLLLVTRNLRLIDVEVKISRADLRADAKKAKWWESRTWQERNLPPLPRHWPPKVWKHYYAVPRDVWTDDLGACIPAASGVLLLSYRGGKVNLDVGRAAKPNRDAQPVSAADAVDIARLAGLRMWDALLRLEAGPN